MNRIKYQGTLIAVSDMERSKRFYCELLGLSVEGDFGANVQLSGGIYLQTLESWQGFLPDKAVLLGNHASELYFETEDLDDFCKRMEAFDAERVHPLLEHRWGQRVIRIYDPDHHIIEVAEDITMVARRFFVSGMTEEQVAERMDVPAEYVHRCLQSSI